VSLAGFGLLGGGWEDIADMFFFSSQWGSDFVRALTQSGDEIGVAGKHGRCDSGFTLEDLMMHCAL
jgi:hypothetical protein